MSHYVVAFLLLLLILVRIIFKEAKTTIRFYGEDRVQHSYVFRNWVYRLVKKLEQTTRYPTPP